MLDYDSRMSRSVRVQYPTVGTDASNKKEMELPGPEFLRRFFPLTLPADFNDPPLRFPRQRGTS